LAQPSKTITGLRELRGGGRVAVSLDGTAWRTLPGDAVVRAGLLVGARLDRSKARELARELRRSRALAVAARTLSRRDHSRRELELRLSGAGVPEEGRQAALATLERAGVVDDERFARSRAVRLAERGRGDAAIRWDLERRGLAVEQVEQALAELEPEAARAARIVAKRGPGPTTAGFLARRGFGDEVVASAAELGIGYEH
jgi:regulatory protein